MSKLFSDETLAHYGVLCHSGKEGMKWGYNDGKSNGKRKAGEVPIKTASEASNNLNPNYESLPISTEIRLAIEKRGEEILSELFDISVPGETNRSDRINRKYEEVKNRLKNEDTRIDSGYNFNDEYDIQQLVKKYKKKNQ